eukprot:GHVQ01020559.1.p2 GENE.GHVQ01020559.1~~GHVQ01020559.1.p2  ORF type:complete len:132 (-),score=25.59 GHVQ01020559.1:586-981(-)
MTQRWLPDSIEHVYVVLCILNSGCVYSATALGPTTCSALFSTLYYRLKEEKQCHIPYVVLCCTPPPPLSRCTSSSAAACYSPSSVSSSLHVGGGGLSAHTHHQLSLFHLMHIGVCIYRCVCVYDYIYIYYM